MTRSASDPEFANAAEVLPPLAVTAAAAPEVGKVACGGENLRPADSSNAASTDEAQSPPVAMSGPAIDFEREDTETPMPLPKSSPPGNVALAVNRDASALGTAHSRSESIFTETGVDETWDWNDDEPVATESRATAAPASSPSKSAGSPSPPSAQEPSLPGPEAVPTSSVRREKMMVSRQSREIIAIAEQVLKEAFEVSSPG